MLALVFVLAPAWADGVPFDGAHSKLAAVMSGAVSTSGVDWGTIASRRATLDAYLAEVATAPVANLSHDQQLALYINAYNACTMSFVVSAYPGLKSIQDLDGGKVWDTRPCVVGGQSYTLNQLEGQYVRKLGDGRVHAAVNCASKGCPPLAPAPFTADGLDSQLDAAAKRWAGANLVRIDGDTAYVSQIFDWYGADFTRYVQSDLAASDAKGDAALWFASRYVDAATASKLTSGALKVQYAPYDWGLNVR